MGITENDLVSDHWWDGKETPSTKYESHVADVKALTEYWDSRDVRNSLAGKIRYNQRTESYADVAYAVYKNRGSYLTYQEIMDEVGLGKYRVREIVDWYVKHGVFLRKDVNTLAKIKFACEAARETVGEELTDDNKTFGEREEEIDERREKRLVGRAKRRLSDRLKDKVKQTLDNVSHPFAIKWGKRALDIASEIRTSSGDLDDAQKQAEAVKDAIKNAQDRDTPQKHRGSRESFSTLSESGLDLRDLWIISGYNDSVNPDTVALMDGLDRPPS
jgi:F0F1-type ATP synthase epsilon subunit